MNCGATSVQARTNTGFYSQSGSFNKIEGKNFSVTDVLTSAFFTHRTLEGKRLSRNIGGSGNLELSYDIDSFRVLSIYGNVGRFHAESQTDQNVLTEFKSAPAIRSYLLQQSNFRNPAYGGGADWIRKFRSTPDKEFTARFNAQFSRNEGEATGFQDNLSTGRYILNTTSSKNAEYSFQLDYATPINKIRIETGAKSVIRKAASDYLGMIKYNLTDEFIVDPNNANNFRYGQQVYSGYGSLVLNKQNSSFRFGLRAEHTDINGRYFSSHSFVQQHYTNLIPNIQVTARVGSFYTIVASYNLRLQRPFITNLNPFVNNTDSLNISFGNPNLGPQVIHSGSLQARYVDKAFFASAMLTGSYTGNMVIQYASFNPSNGITSLTYDNAGKEYILGLALNVSTPIGKKITAGISSVFRYNYITNRVVVSQHRSGFTSIAFGNFSWKVVGKFTVNASGGTTRNPYTLLNHPQRQYFYQVNLGYRFMHDKFSATVNFNNFHSRYFNIKTVTEDANFKTQNVTTAPYRVIFFGCTYNFGKLKEATSKKRGIVNDDLIQ